MILETMDSLYVQAVLPKARSITKRNREILWQQPADAKDGLSYALLHMRQPSVYPFNDYQSAQAKLNFSAGSMRPTHSPKPTKASSSDPHTPRIVISSPSSKKVLFSPPSRAIVSFPLLLCSRKLPYSAGEFPLMVPEPSRSPGWKGHPVMVWCVSICGNDQSRFRAFTFDTVVLLPVDAEDD